MHSLSFPGGPVYFSGTVVLYDGMKQGSHHSCVCVCVCARARVFIGARGSGANGPSGRDIYGLRSLETT